MPHKSLIFHMCYWSLLLQVNDLIHEDQYMRRNVLFIVFSSVNFSNGLNETRPQVHVHVSVAALKPNLSA